MSGPETKTFTVALGQMHVEGGDPSGNLARATAMIEESASRGARIVLLPEALDCGWCDRSARDLAGPIPGGDAFQVLARSAAAHRIHVCAGLIERTEHGLFNAAVLLGPDGSLLLKHHKVHELALATDLYRTGHGARAVCPTPYGMVGLMICADGFFPGEALTRNLARLGAHLILSPCAWAVPPDHDQEKTPYGALWRDVYGRVARDHQIWIAGTSNVGTIRHGDWAGHPCIGSSMLVGPDGSVRAQAAYGREAAECLLVDLPTRL